MRTIFATYSRNLRKRWFQSPLFLPLQFRSTPYMQCWSVWFSVPTKESRSLEAWSRLQESCPTIFLKDLGSFSYQWAIPFHKFRQSIIKANPCQQSSIVLIECLQITEKAIQDGETVFAWVNFGLIRSTMAKFSRYPLPFNDQCNFLKKFLYFFQFIIRSFMRIF